MAGAIAEISRFTLAKNFCPHRSIAGTRNPHRRRARPCSPRIRRTCPRAREKQLLELGVEVRTNARPTNITEEGVQLDGEFIPCRVKIWAAGNVASFVGKTLSVPVDRVGRVIVNDDLTIPGHPEVQVIGDLANFSHQTGDPLPGVSPVAMQTGAPRSSQHFANDPGEKPEPFRYFDKGKHGYDRPQ